MINYNIVSKRIGRDPYGIEKAAFSTIEKNILDRVKNKLAQFESELGDNTIDVNIDFNEKNFMKVTSPGLPHDLIERIQSALSELGN